MLGELIAQLDRPEVAAGVLTTLDSRPPRVRLCLNNGGIGGIPRPPLDCGRHDEGSSVAAFQLSPRHHKHNLPESKKHS